MKHLLAKRASKSESAQNITQLGGFAAARGNLFQH